MNRINKSVFITCIVCFLCLVNYVFAGNPDTPSIVGVVTEEESHERLPYLTVLIKGTTIGTSTNAEGEFVLDGLKPGKYTIRVQGVGYKPRERKIILKRGETVRLNISMEEDIFEIEGAVVSANKNKKDRTETPVIVNSLTPAMFKQTESSSLVESLNFTPGLRTENSCQNCGVTQLRMNGLKGEYTQILINSKPIFSSLASIYGIEQIPVSLIERVEVVRGGGSALFGGSAIAGTVNIITKDPVNDQFDVSMRSLFMEGNREDVSVDFSTSIVNEKHTTGISINGLNRNREYFDANSDGFSEIPRMENTSLGLNAFVRPTNLSKIKLDLHKIHEFRRGGNNFAALPHDADITEQVRHDINGGSLSFEKFGKDQDSKFSAFVSGQLMDRDSYYGTNENPAAYGETHNDKLVVGTQYSFNADNFLFSPAEINLGAEDVYDVLDDRKLGFDTIPGRIIAKQYSNTIGGYLQSEWNMDWFKLLFGIRVDHYKINDQYNEGNNVTGTAISPRTNLLFDIKKNYQIRLSYAKGYRAPKIYSEDLHIESSKARKIIHRNDPDLAEEVSHSFSASFDYTGKFFNKPIYFLLEGFYTYLQDPFANEIIEEDQYNLTYLRVNASGGAVVKGINMEGNFLVGSSLNVKLGFTMEDNKYKNPQQWGELPSSKTKEMLRTPSSYGYLMANWDINKKLNFSFTGNYTSSILVPHMGIHNPDPSQQEAIDKGYVIKGEELYETKPFFDLGTKLSYSLFLSNGLKVTFKGGVKNLLQSYQSNFDSGVYRDAGFMYGPALPRTFYFSVNLGNILK
jgi:outer membrane receptor for ferrienterochelin and colicins